MKSCFIDQKFTRFLDLYSVLDMLNERGYGLDSDDLFSLFDGIDGLRNDSYWRLYRHWIKGDKERNLWDIICFELDIDQNMPEMSLGGYVPSLQLVFWVSW